MEYLKKAPIRNIEDLRLGTKLETGLQAPDQRCTLTGIAQKQEFYAMERDRLTRIFTRQREQPLPEKEEAEKQEMSP